MRLWVDYDEPGGFLLFSRRLAQTSSVATAIRSFMQPILSRAGRTSKEKTGEPSGSEGAE